MSKMTHSAEKVRYGKIDNIIDASFVYYTQENTLQIFYYVHPEYSHLIPPSITPIKVQSQIKNSRLNSTTKLFELIC